MLRAVKSQISALNYFRSFLLPFVSYHTNKPLFLYFIFSFFTRTGVVAITGSMDGRAEEPPGELTEPLAGLVRRLLTGRAKTTYTCCACGSVSRHKDRITDLQDAPGAAGDGHLAADGGCRGWRDQRGRQSVSVRPRTAAGRLGGVAAGSWTHSRQRWLILRIRHHPDILT